MGKGPQLQNYIILYICFIYLKQFFFKSNPFLFKKEMTKIQLCQWQISTINWVLMWRAKDILGIDRRVNYVYDYIFDGRVDYVFDGRAGFDFDYERRLCPHMRNNKLAH